MHRRPAHGSIHWRQLMAPCGGTSQWERLLSLTAAVLHSWWHSLIKGAGGTIFWLKAFVRHVHPLVVRQYHCTWTAYLNFFEMDNILRWTQNKPSCEWWVTCLLSVYFIFTHLSVHPSIFRLNKFDLFESAAYTFSVVVLLKTDVLRSRMERCLFRN